MAAIPRATDFNSVVFFDLKCIGEKYILWMMYFLTMFVKGVVVRNNKVDTIIKLETVEGLLQNSTKCCLYGGCVMDYGDDMLVTNSRI